MYIYIYIYFCSAQVPKWSTYTFGKINCIDFDVPKEYLVGYGEFPFLELVQSTNTIYIIYSIILAVPRWTVDQLYVNEVKVQNPDIKTNKKGGATISIRKSGWGASFNHAKQMAGWLDN